MKKLLILFSVIFSCKNIEKKNDIFSEFKNDTIFSKGNEILFFMPNENFFNKNLKNFEGSEETDADFKHYSNEVYNDIQNKSNFPIKAKITESRFLGIINLKNDTTYIDRYKDSLDYGTLLNFTNKKYIIEEGIFTHDDFFENLIPLQKEIDETKLKQKIPEKIKIRSFEENPPKELIIVRSDIKEHLDFEFIYEELENQKEKNRITFFNKNFKVIIEKQKFKNKKTYKEDDFYGVNYDFPIEIVSSFDLFFNELKIDNKINFKDLAEPNFNLSKAYQIDKENIIIEMHNSDGAGGYAVYFFINKDGLNKRYIVYP